MNIPDLFALTAQNNPSTLLNPAKKNPQDIVFQNTDETQTTQTTETTDTENAGEEFTTFLTLLTAQIRNQDPLAPLDSTQFVEQLATFSNLELQAEANQTLESIARLLDEQNNNTSA